MIHTGLVVAVGENKENILQDRNVELSEEDAGGLHISLSHVVHKLQTHGETRVLHLAVVVFAGPHARINHKFELRGIQLQKCWEAVQIDGLEQFEELHTMFGVFVEILVDHLQGTVEDAFHDGGNLVLHQILHGRSAISGKKHQDKTYVKLMDDGGHGVQNLCLSRIRDISVIIHQDCFKKWGHHVGIDHLEIVRLLHVGVDELQDFLFDGAKPSNLGSLWRNAPCNACQFLDYRCFTRR